MSPRELIRCRPIVARQPGVWGPRRCRFPRNGAAPDASHLPLAGRNPYCVQDTQSYQLGDNQGPTCPHEPPSEADRRPTRFSRPLVFPTLPSRGAGSMISKPGPCFLCRRRSTDGPTVSLEAQRLRPGDAHDLRCWERNPPSHPQPPHAVTHAEKQPYIQITDYVVHRTTRAAIWQRNRRHEVSAPETGEARRSSSPFDANPSCEPFAG